MSVPGSRARRGAPGCAGPLLGVDRGLPHEDGSALVEVVWLGVLLLVPLVYLVLAVFDVQRAAFGATQAAREAGRAYVVSGGSTAEAEAAAQVALADQRLPLRPGQLRVTCSSHPCATAGAVVTVRVDTAVALPFVPRLLGRTAATVAVHARHDERVDCYRAGVAPPVDPAGCP